MSLPNVIALTKLIESMVDIIIAKSDTKNMPNKPWGSTFDANNGYAIRGLSGTIIIYEYNPAVIVRISKINQNPIDMTSPFFALFGLFTEEHL